MSRSEITSPTTPYRMGSPTPSRSSSHMSNRDKVSVNVAIRVKPAFANTPPLGSPPTALRASVVEAVTDNSITVNSHSTKKKYQYDKLFDQASTQEDLFGYISDSVASFIKGYNVSIMAYGQSGSGKSYTMGTSENLASVNDPQSMGLISRVARELFKNLAAKAGVPKSAVSSPVSAMNTGLPVLTATSKVRRPRSIVSNTGNTGSFLKSTPWSLTVSYLEIYNEQLRDLLKPPGSATFSSLKSSENPLNIREDAKGNISVSGLKEVVVESLSDLLRALHQGSSTRQTSSTAVNVQSSRSHAIFTVHLTERMQNLETGITTTATSKMNFVDLAGSERLKNTQVSDGRVREGISINAGLTVLGKVISQLSQNQAHVSYRDSKLTRLLQDSLGGKAITYLIACITTDPLFLAETLNTLSYAQRARSIQLAPEIQQSQGENMSREELILTIVEMQRELQLYKGTTGSLSRDTLAFDSGQRPTMGGSMHLSPPVSPKKSSFTTFQTSGLISATSLYASSPDRPVSVNGSSDSARERINRSSVIHSAVQDVMGQYDDTIASLQGTISELRLANIEKDEVIEATEQSVDEIQALNLLYKERITFLEGQITQLKLTFSPAIAQKEFRTSIENELQDSTVSGVDTEELDENKPEINNLEQEIRSMHAEILAYRKEQISHMSESQYLTTQYNRSRLEVLRLNEEKKQLKEELTRLGWDAYAGTAGEGGSSMDDLSEPRTPQKAVQSQGNGTTQKDEYFFH